MKQHGFNDNHQVNTETSEEMREKMFYRKNYFSKVFLTIEEMFSHIDEHQL